MGQHWVSGEGGRDGTALGEWGGREGWDSTG